MLAVVYYVPIRVRNNHPVWLEETSVFVYYVPIRVRNLLLDISKMVDILVYYVPIRVRNLQTLLPLLELRVGLLRPYKG